MLTKNRILGVADGKLVMRPQQREAISARKSRGNLVTAGLGTGAGSGGPSVSVMTAWSSEYQYYMTGLLPGAEPYYQDPKALAIFNRDIYLYDNTAGSAVDIQSTFPFSDYELRGLDEKELEPFQSAVEQLNIRRMMPKIAWAYLVDGFFCGSLIFDPVKRNFLDTWIHDALQCSVKHTPLYNMDPEVHVLTDSFAKYMLTSASPYVKRYMNMMPQSFIKLLRQGQMTLDPIATLFVARESMTDRSYVSYLQRILPMYLIEKAMFRGTLTEAHRRQRAMTHITAGDDVWTPTSEELKELVEQFQTAEYDPLGGWVSTRNSVQSTDLRPAGDFWKWTDMTDIMVAYKLRALGISEALLSGDASYAAAESAYSTFLESQDSFRGYMTTKTFEQKIFPLVAATNGLYKDKKKGHGNDAINFLFDSTVRANLKMPTVYWHKQLEADPQESMMEMLSMLDEKGIPVPMKMWITAARMDPDTLLRELRDDAELRKQLEQVTGKDTSHDQDEFMPEDYEEDDQSGGDDGTGLVNASFMRNRKIPILARDWGDEGLLFDRTVTGKKKHVFDQVGRRKKHNENIVKAALNARDPDYREFLRQRNISKLGTDTIPGASDLKKRK